VDGSQGKRIQKITQIKKPGISSRGLGYNL